MSLERPGTDCRASLQNDSSEDIPVDTLDFRQNPVRIRKQEPATPNSIEKILHDDKDNHSVDDRAGSLHSTELDPVDMHVQQLVLEMGRDEDARSSVDIAIAQTPELTGSDHITGRAV